jgi:hypothetical protein
MPERFELQFLHEDGSWWSEATCFARRFERLADGSYICSEFSTGLWIRCVEKHDDHFVHVDGAGKRHRYRLMPLPMPAERS